MAVVKPVVFGPDGALRNIQAGDTLAGGSETGIINLTAAAALIAGNAVYSSAAGAVNKAQANAAGTRTVIGLTTGAIASAASGPVQVNGVLSLSTAQWDAVCGTTGGLTPNTPYFNSPTTAGLLTATVPTTTGQYSTQVGIATSTTEMIIDPRSPFLI